MTEPGRGGGRQGNPPFIPLLRAGVRTELEKHALIDQRRDGAVDLLLEEVHVVGGVDGTYGNVGNVLRDVEVGKSRSHWSLRLDVLEDIGWEVRKGPPSALGETRWRRCTAVQETFSL